MQRARSGSLLASIFLLLASAAAPSAGTLEQVRESGTLRLGYVTEARPFSYRDGSGNPAGYAVALCQKLAETVKSELKLSQLKIEFVEVPGAERFDALPQGKIDVLCTGGAPTVSRRKRVSFSIPVFLGGIGALMRDDAPARIREVLEGRPEPYQPRWRATLGQVLRDRTYLVFRGTTTIGWVKERLGELQIPAKVEEVDDLATGVDKVAARRADVLFADRALLLSAAASSPAAGDLVVLERHFTDEAPALALPRGDEDLRLLVDRSLSELYRSGGISAVYTPYFGKPTAQTLRFLRIGSLPE